MPELDVYTLPDLYDTIDDKSDAVGLSIKDYMDANPDGFGVMERDDSDLEYPVTPVFAKIGGDVRLVLVRDVDYPDQLDKMRQKRENELRGMPSSGVSDSINRAVYATGGKSKAEKRAEDVQKVGFFDRLFQRMRNVVAEDHTSNESQRMIVQNQWKNLFRKAHMSTGVNILASRVTESEYKLREAKSRIGEAVKASHHSSSALSHGDSKELEEKKVMERFRKYVALRYSRGIVSADDSSHFSREEIEKFETMLGDKKKSGEKGQDKGKDVKKTQISDELFNGLRKKREEEKNYSGHKYTPL